MKRILLLSCALALTGCGQGDKAPSSGVIQLPATDHVAETINGTPVPWDLLESVARQHNLHLDVPQQREQAMKVLTDFVLVAQDAAHESFSSQPGFLADVEAARLKGIADATFNEFQKQLPIGDDTLKAEYDAQSARTGTLVWDFSQLLFADEGDALKAEADVIAGKPFPQVYDTWRTKAKQAKAFTRVRQDQIPEALGKALALMKNGESSKVPIKTEYGWHVVHLDIVNPYTPPPFDQVKEGIRHSMQMKIGQERLKKLRETAKIEYPAGSAPASTDKPAEAPADKAAEKPAEEKKG